MTTLHLATINNHVEVVEALLKAPGSLNVNSICHSPMYSFPEYVELDNASWTSLQLAAHMGHVRILELLVKVCKHLSYNHFSGYM
jgi:ankyrin repeat protein